ncbi:hypothetical protein DRP43_01335 [candidate division TA06 bacterium]|uniref:Uncharacterized protein n=1 Tax=candidate division TA06 bacterium TaxID=2250710 RepID=A0A660SQ43_UNCT6|nr:MAG: hypothetical protein DRP43_01335 [candidate division TA06 bacterium]
MTLEKYSKKDFYFWVSKIEEIKNWILDTKEILEIKDIEADVIVVMPASRTRMQEYMEEHPEEITEESAQKLHDFDVFIYENIDLAYSTFSEFYWKRSEYAPPKSHWWWWLDDYFEGARDINPDDVWIEWERRKGK